MAITEDDIRLITPAFKVEVARAIDHVEDILDLLTNETRRQTEIKERREQLTMLLGERDRINAVSSEEQ